MLQSIVGYDRRSRGTRAAGQRLVLDAPFIGAHTDRSVARDLDEIDVRTAEPPRIVTDTPARVRLRSMPSTSCTIST